MNLMIPLRMNRGKMAAIRLRQEIGIDGPDDIALEDVIAGRGGIVIYTPMGNTDGRIVYGEKLSTIYINSDIKYPGRVRFALAHELGHLEMHKGSPMHEDSVTLEWFDNTESNLKRGTQEYEANQFATEYLMPTDLFTKEAQGKFFNPNLIHYLSNRFSTSLTSTAFKCFDCSVHPMLLVHTFRGRVKYWKKSQDLNFWVKSFNQLLPPEDSVALEYIKEDYGPIYKGDELQQEIRKSTYFTLRDGDEDTVFYEYCIVTKAYENILSIIWEE